MGSGNEIVNRAYARFIAHALNTFYCRGALGNEVNPDTIGCLWTGELDLNTLRLDGKIFDCGKKKLLIQKYPDRYRPGLSQTSQGYFFREIGQFQSTRARNNAALLEHVDIILICQH